MTQQDDKQKYQSELKEIMKGAAMYTSASILGPLLLFGGVGMLLDYHFQKSPLFLLIGVGIAFIFTNIFLFRRAKEMTAQMNEYAQTEMIKNKQKKKNINK
jgi:F0F1-type ATP synthase assembly protein I